MDGTSGLTPHRSPVPDFPLDPSWKFCNKPAPQSLSIPLRHILRFRQIDSAATLRPPRKACPMRISPLLVVGAWCGLLIVGCSHMVEKRVVRAFAESLKEHDLAALQ